MVHGPDNWDLVDLSMGALRVALLTGLVTVYVALATRRYRQLQKQLSAEDGHKLHNDSDEETPLLNGQHPAGYHGTRGDGQHRHRRSQSNGSDHSDADDSTDNNQEEQVGFYRPDKLPRKTWFEYCRGYTIFFPYLWPSKSKKLQMVFLLCLTLVFAQRAINVLVPLQLGIVTNYLRDDENRLVMPWMQLILLMIYKLLQGQSGVLGSIRSILWVPVSQHTYKELTTAAFEHVHKLSLDFHLKKKTGELLSALNKGASINTFLEQATFFVIPMVVDLFIAIIFFHLAFGPLYSLCVAIITFFYLYVSVQMAQTRVDQRREMVNADREEEAVKNDSVTAYETVKYFNAEKFEFARYRGAVNKFQGAEAKVTHGIQLMNMAQSAVFMSGIFFTLIICGFEVTQGTRTVGDFVLLITYLNQLQGPLNFFGSFYRTVQSAMISGERLLEIFKLQANVEDSPNAKDLVNCQGHIRWSNVKFNYDKRKPALNDISFECAPGTTTALVGESGGGKSTVFKLMFRFYDVVGGSIEIDGQNVQDLKIDSVRKVIGVVPQDTVLFNETLMYNLRYANQKATDEEVYEACRAAAIHDRIMSFPDKYNTKVGERGLRLSGGERQRVAIARTILKQPKIILLDEATSALDTETEHKIQAKMISGSLGQGRTVLVIA
jgi:ABC-type transport system involved in Fe-S cluster assembly fused permease/ATPase subunit